MSEKLKISEVKGRPMLNWIGKKTINIEETYPAQLVETFNNDKKEIKLNYNDLIKDWNNLLFHGDNIEVLTNILNNGFRGKIDLIYIDPPFDSKADYIRKVKLRGEGHNKLEQKQYFDIWKNDDYLQFMYERLILLKELLSDKGSIYLHCDWHKNHHLRCLMDEVFGEENFKSEIILKSSATSGRVAKPKKFDMVTSSIFLYHKNKDTFLNKLYSYRNHSEEFCKTNFKFDEEEEKYYKDSPLGNYGEETIKDLEKINRIRKTNTGNLRVKTFLEKLDNKMWREKISINNLWVDIPTLMHISKFEKSDYPTQNQRNY